MTLGIVNKLTIVNRFDLLNCYDNITHLAIKTRIQIENLNRGV